MWESCSIRARNARRSIRLRTHARNTAEIRFDCKLRPWQAISAACMTCRRPFSASCACGCADKSIKALKELLRQKTSRSRKFPTGQALSTGITPQLLRAGSEQSDGLGIFTRLAIRGHGTFAVGNSCHCPCCVAHPTFSALDNLPLDVH